MQKLRCDQCPEGRRKAAEWRVWYWCAADHGLLAACQQLRHGQKRHRHTMDANCNDCVKYTREQGFHTRRLTVEERKRTNKEDSRLWHARNPK